jgi:hypothetical protein
MCNHRLHPSSPLEHYDRGARLSITTEARAPSACGSY